MKDDSNIALQVILDHTMALFQDELSVRFTPDLDLRSERRVIRFPWQWG